MATRNRDEELAIAFAEGKAAVAQNVAAQQDADKFALLAKDIVSAAEALTMRQKFSVETEEEFHTRMTAKRSWASYNIALYAAVLRYRKARSEDTRR